MLLTKPGLRSLFRPVFDLNLCDGCGRCAEECSFNEIRLETRGGRKIPVANGRSCGACHRCEYTCPLGAVNIEEKKMALREHGLWQREKIHRIHLQAASGSIALTGMGAETEIPVYWDHLLFNACQVTILPLIPRGNRWRRLLTWGKKRSH